MNPRPFLKWAGGKTQLLPKILPYVPEKIGTYYEPFIGAGALFWKLAEEGRFERAVINDFNWELANVYRVVRDFPDELIGELRKMPPIEKTWYLAVRDWNPREVGPVIAAARTIWLNKTGFNGLYRVSKKTGAFNVPFGQWKKPPKVFDPDHLHACSEALNKFTVIRQGDFTDAVMDAGPGDFVYFDPPYLPLSPTSNFRSYTVGGFTLNDQHRLGACFRDLADGGIEVLASNSDTEMTRSIYEDFNVVSVPARRSINRDGESRGSVNEILVTSSDPRPPS